MVTWFLPEETARRGEKGRRRHCVAVDAESQLSPNLHSGGSPPFTTHQLSTHLSGKCLPMILIFSVKAVFSWMSASEERRSRCGRHNNLLGTSGACALFGAITRPSAKSHGTSTGLWTVHFLRGKNGRCRKLVFVILYSNILYFKEVSFELTLWDITISILELMKPEYVLPI